VPEVLDTKKLDGVVTISNEDAVAMALRLAREEGLLCGISSGANVAAAVEYGSRSENAGKTIVTMICDFGERYIQTVLFADLRYDGSDEIDV
jgi:cysteine synthase A